MKRAAEKKGDSDYFKGTKKKSLSYTIGGRKKKKYILRGNLVEKEGDPKKRTLSKKVRKRTLTFEVRGNQIESLSEQQKREKTFVKEK